MVSGVMAATVYEEVGHGGSASVPEGVTDILSVDMGCVGDGLECKEHQVSLLYDFDHYKNKKIKARIMFFRLFIRTNQRKCLSLPQVFFIIHH